MTSLSGQQLLDKIHSFDYWHYGFDLGNGVAINPTREGYTEKRLQIKNFIWPAVLELCGGSLKGMRVLDIGCNAGFWSLEAHRAGAEYVLGIDARPTHVQQAELVRDALGIGTARMEFRQMDIYNLSRDSVGGEYDLVLLLRVLNRLSSPLLALEKIREVCRGCLVADVHMIADDQPMLQLKTQDQADPRTGVGMGLGLRPSRSAVQLMLTHSGFTDVREVPPQPPLPANYFNGTRSVFTARVANSTTNTP